MRPTPWAGHPLLRPLRRLLGYLVTLRFAKLRVQSLRFAKLRVQSWGWWYVRSWRREESNRAYMKQLQ